MGLLLYIYGSMNGSFYCFFHCSFSQWDFWSLSPRECAEPPWLPLKTDGNRLFLLKDLSNAQKKGPWMTWTMNHPDWFNPYNGWVVYGSIIPYGMTWTMSHPDWFMTRSWFHGLLESPIYQGTLGCTPSGVPMVFIEVFQGFLGIITLNTHYIGLI